MTTPASSWEERGEAQPDNPCRTSAAALTKRRFGYINATEQIAQSTAGGTADGVVAFSCDAAGDQATLYTEGRILVEAGGTVTAGGNVMSDSSGRAVDATFGNKLLGYAETGTTSAGDLVRIFLFERPHHLMGGGLGSESVVSLPVTGTALHASTTLGIINPAGVNVIITRAILYTTTVSTGAATADVGVTTVSIATASDNLMDGMNLAVTAPNAQSRLQGDATANSKDSQIWTAAKWVTITELADSTGFVGTLFIFYIIPA